MKPKKQKLAVVTYEERALLMHKKAMAQEFKEVARDYKSAKLATEKMKGDCIAAANACRAVGIRLQALCGHEQIDFEFWNKNGCEKKLPFNFNSAKIFIALARKMPKPVKTIEEAAPFTQLCFQAGNLIELPVREEAQHSFEVGITQKFFAEITIIRRDWAKVLRQSPMEQWNPVQLDGFIKETKWLADERAKAEKLKNEKSS